MLGVFSNLLGGKFLNIHPGLNLSHEIWRYSCLCKVGDTPGNVVLLVLVLPVRDEEF